jgi:hypothetical protein
VAGVIEHDLVVTVWYPAARDSVRVAERDVVRRLYDNADPLRHRRAVVKHRHLRTVVLRRPRRIVISWQPLRTLLLRPR